jgi:hypothetical protein
MPEDDGQQRGTAQGHDDQRDDLRRRVEISHVLVLAAS